MGKFARIKLFYFFILPTNNTFGGPTIKSVWRQVRDKNFAI